MAQSHLLEWARCYLGTISLLPVFHFYLSGASKATLLLPDWFLCDSLHPRGPAKQTNKQYPANGHPSLLWLTTNHLISLSLSLFLPLPPPPVLHLPQTRILSLSLSLSLSASSIPVPLVLVCLNVCFCSVSLQKQMASSLSWIQCRGCVGWNLMPTCSPRHAFHTPNGSLLSVCLHCWG